MQDIMLNLFPDSRVQSVLALRPLALSVFESMGVNPYTAPQLRLAEACALAGLPWNALRESLAKLPVPSADSPWRELPVRHLLDFLTAEHREFIGTFIPAIKSGFAAGAGRPEYLGPLAPMMAAWPGFSASLIEHIASEEGFLFPKILRYAYCLDHVDTDPGFPDGSVKVFAALHLLRSEEKQGETIRAFLETASFSASFLPEEAPAGGLIHLLSEFHRRLIDHSRLERDVLLPLAESLEKRLYDRHIAGATSRAGRSDLSPA